MASDEATSRLPQALIVQRRRPSAYWVLPVATMVLAVWIGYRSWAERGLVITVQLEQGHGLAAGDEIRYRGIVVGTVRDVEVSDGLEGIVVTAALQTHSAQIARAGARFWVVRPQLNLAEVAGLETIIGPRYLAVLPGEGERKRNFVGLEAPPVVSHLEPGDIEIVLEASRRGGIRAGAPLTYRQVPIGTVLSVGLASDAGAVEVRVHVRKAYVQLIRRDSRFWNVSGLNAQFGLGGVSLDVDSLETLFAGGIALATPPDAGDVVHNGHRFPLFEKADEEWLTWSPLVAIGSSFLPPGTAMPAPSRIVLTRKSGGWLRSDRSFSGWGLQTDRGLLGPADLLDRKGDDETGSYVLEVAGQPVPLQAAPAWSEGGLAQRDVHVADSVWPSDRLRVPSDPEDCIAVADPNGAPLPLAASRLTLEDGAWMIDSGIAMDVAWHGACVLSRQDGRIVGLVLVDNGGPRVALISERLN